MSRFAFDTEFPEDWIWTTFDNKMLVDIHIPKFMEIIIKRPPDVDLGTGASGRVGQYNLGDKSYIVKKIRVSNKNDKCIVKNEIELLHKIKEFCEPQFSCLLGWGSYPERVGRSSEEKREEDVTPTVYLFFFPTNPGFYTLQRYMAPESVVKTHGYIAGLEVCLNLAYGLNRLHRFGIAHRDIKPENLLVNSQTLAIKYIDFGGSCEEQGYGPSCTTACTAVSRLSKGTLGYYSPEQGWAHAPRAAYNADVYSLGIVFYNVLEGKLPWNVAPYEYEIRLGELELLDPTSPNYYCIPDDALSDTSLSYPQILTFFKLIQEMTRLEPITRPTMSAVVSELKTLIQTVKKLP